MRRAFLAVMLIPLAERLLEHDTRSLLHITSHHTSPRLQATHRRGPTVEAKYAGRSRPTAKQGAAQGFICAKGVETAQGPQGRVLSWALVASGPTDHHESERVRVERERERLELVSAASVGMACLHSRRGCAGCSHAQRSLAILGYLGRVMCALVMCSAEQGENQSPWDPCPKAQALRVARHTLGLDIAAQSLFEAPEPPQTQKSKVHGPERRAHRLSLEQATQSLGPVISRRTVTPRTLRKPCRGVHTFCRMCSSVDEEIVSHRGERAPRTAGSIDESRFRHTMVPVPRIEACVRRYGQLTSEYAEVRRSAACSPVCCRVIISTPRPFLTPTEGHNVLSFQFGCASGLSECTPAPATHHGLHIPLTRTRLPRPLHAPVLHLCTEFAGVGWHISGQWYVGARSISVSPASARGLSGLSSGRRAW